MSRVRIERTPVQIYNLGLFGFDHLQLVYEPGLLGEPQDNWLVLEGVRDPGTNGPTLGVIGDDGDTTLAEANGNRTGDDLVDYIGTPSARGSRILPLADPANAWAAMTVRAQDIEVQLLPYVAYGLSSSAIPTINSASAIATLLHSIGIDVTTMLPSGLRFSPGHSTLIGSRQDDAFSLSGHFTTLIGGGGNDTLAGSATASQVDKLYGGSGDDRFLWGDGVNVYHGGQPQLDYRDDGTDTVDYTGVGVVSIERSLYSIPHFVADFVATHAAGTDYLFSIEKIAWDLASDTVLLGKGVELVENDVTLDLGDEAPSGQGDTVDFSDASGGLLINASAAGTLFAQSGGSAADNKGVWISSAEWLVGSGGDDSVYASETLRGADGGEGHDRIDARLASPFQALSPAGYDIELRGGEGDDTLISNGGRSYGEGGSGADTYVLSTLTGPNGQTVEYVIAGAESSDRLYVPYNLLNGSGLGFDGSALLPLLGGAAQLAGAASFADLPQNEGSFINGPSGRSDYFPFIWQLQEQTGPGTDPTAGVIPFAGAVLYNREGNDLLIHVFPGEIVQVTETDSNGEEVTLTLLAIDYARETLIRVEDFEEGMLGIEFHDLGEPDYIEYETPDGGFVSRLDYPYWDDAVRAMTNNGTLGDPLELRPDAPVIEASTGSGSGGNSSLAVLGGAGNDSLLGSISSETLNGAAGADIMEGLGGNDTYVVDDDGDSVIEAERGGFDTVRTAVSYTLPEHVEHLTLAAAGLQGTGNDGRNRLIGSEGDDTLAGLGGDDTLFGARGNDRLEGGDGNDGYIYFDGDGDDTILDVGELSDADLLVYQDLVADDVEVYRSPTDLDVLMLRLSNGDRVTIDNFAPGSSDGIDGIRFADGETWDRTRLEAEAQAAPILVNDDPVARDDGGLAARGRVVTIPAIALLANDFDRDDATVSIIAIGGLPQGFTGTLQGDGSIRLEIAQNYQGVVDFSYTLSDGRGGTDSADVQLVVLPNATPQAGADSGLVATGGTALEIDAEDLIANDSDADGDALSIQSAQGAVHGTVALDAIGRVVFTPDAGYTGAASFDYTVTDGLGATSTAQVSLAIEAGESAPEPNIILGTAQANTLTGTETADVIDGRGGRDTIFGLGGDDVFLVTDNRGRDHFDGGEGFDTIQGNGADNIIKLAAAGDMLPGIEAIDGADGFDVLRLTASDDVLDLSAIAVSNLEFIEARGGHDTIIASHGNDRVAGGAGNDKFVFGADFGHDVITDFDTGTRKKPVQDVIDLSAAQFNNFTDLKSHAVQEGDDVVITVGPDSSLTLENINLTDLRADDFILA